MWKRTQEWEDRRILIKQLIQSQGIPVLDGFSLHYGLEKGGKEKERPVSLPKFRGQ